MFTFAKNPNISYRLLTIAWQLFDSDGKFHYYGTDQLLYEAEIHMIMHIKDNPDLHLAALAEKLGVTRGAVSQVIKKLEKKGMLTKSKSQTNRSMLQISLTAKGETAYKQHRLYHDEFDNAVNSILTSATPAEQEFLIKFLDNLEGVVEKFKHS